MTLPQVAFLCDAFELAALTLQRPLSLTELAKLFFPGQDLDEPIDFRDAAPSTKLRDALGLAQARRRACGKAYPFDVGDRSIRARGIKGFDLYVFLLLGTALDFGGPKNVDELLRKFRTQFEDIVCWAMRKAGFVAEVLSEPRGRRGLPVQLVPALRELVVRFGEAALLREDKLQPEDNDLDVDILAVPLKGNTLRGGWPVFLVQCATGKLTDLQAKVDEGRNTFGSVWDNGFHTANSVRTGATPDDLLNLADNHWNRLCSSGWILDRTRIAFLASQGEYPTAPRNVVRLWRRLWNAKGEIDWQTGWQQAE